MSVRIDRDSFLSTLQRIIRPRGRVEASSMGLAVSQLSLGIGIIGMGLSPIRSHDGQLSPYRVQLFELSRQYLNPRPSAIQHGLN